MLSVSSSILTLWYGLQSVAEVWWVVANQLVSGPVGETKQNWETSAISSAIIQIKTSLLDLCYVETSDF